MEQLEPKENQLPETEQETTENVPEPEGMLLGYDGLEEDFGVPPCPCPCPCPCDEE